MTSIARWPSLPVRDWPQADRDAWSAATAPAGPLDPGGPAAGLAPRTQTTMEELWGGFLYWLQKDGRLDHLAGPGQRMTFEIYVGYLSTRSAVVSANTVFNNLRMLAMMLRCIAPGSDWGWLYRHPLAPRRHEAMAARKPVPRVDLASLFVALRAAFEAVLAQEPNRASAVRLRDLLIVAVTAATALRCRNLLALTIGQNLLAHEQGFEIRVAPHGIKNSKQITILLMPELVGPLRAYLDTYRPVLCGLGDAGQALWVSREGRRLSEPSLQTAVGRIATELLGQAVYPHAFRHAAATTLIEHDPRQIAVASAVLAHRDQTTVARFYDLSTHDAYQQVWARVIANARSRNMRDGSATTSTLRPTTRGKDAT